MMSRLTFAPCCSDAHGGVLDVAPVPVALRRGALRLQDGLHRVRHLRLHPHRRHIHRREVRRAIIALTVPTVSKIQWRSVDLTNAEVQMHKTNQL